ncbi:hypothetical protein BDV36DRAFT_300952 [Aspergillus pseudocaelatus]|uniref:Uncharacterized protein n=1 Tax=Aspergillus pseudocaelatus TaxID=1825620 RepID=A0ABQ6W6W6_9EURO|nr:hypothetical protein BDV36DRAFT_300952 [Aspergillus pseudocaelatus]
MDAPINIGFNDEEANGVLCSTTWPKSHDITFPRVSTSEIFQSETSLALPATTMANTWDPLAGCSRWYLGSKNLDHFENHLAESLSLSTDGIYDLSTELQAHDTSSLTFPDDQILAVPSLTLLNAAVEVAQRLNIHSLMWDFTAISPFYSPVASDSSVALPPSQEAGLLTSPISPASSFDLTGLPSHLLPTRTQYLIPHHPTIDLLPWTSIKDTFIQVFQLRVNLRLPTAQDPIGLMRLVFDIEHGSGEGMKISVDDPFEPSAWEIGQVVFNRWWWASEMSVVERSNRARRNKGERILSFQDQNL